MDRYTDGIVTTPINVADLSQLLNRSQEDINKVEYSNLLTSVGGLCTHPNVNMWSKRKPVNSDKLFPSESELDEVMANANYGIVVENKTDSELALTTYENTVDYSRETIQPPYQMSHFIGYNHKTKCPIVTNVIMRATDFGQEIHSNILMSETDIDFIGVIGKHLEEQNESLSNYYLSVAIIQDNNVVFFCDAYDPINGEFGINVTCVLNNYIQLKEGTDTYAVAMLRNPNKDTNNAISLNLEHGAISETFAYDKYAISEVLNTMSAYYDSTLSFLTLAKDSTTEHYKLSIGTILYKVTIPQIESFMNRYTTSQDELSLNNAKWKLQIKCVGIGDVMYVPNANGTLSPISGWVDLVDYAFIPNESDGGIWNEDTITYDLALSNGEFFGKEQIYKNIYMNSYSADGQNHNVTIRFQLVLQASREAKTGTALAEFVHLEFQSEDISIMFADPLAE